MLFASVIIKERRFIFPVQYLYIFFYIDHLFYLPEEINKSQQAMRGSISLYIQFTFDLCIAEKSQNVRG